MIFAALSLPRCSRLSRAFPAGPGEAQEREATLDGEVGARASVKTSRTLRQLPAWGACPAQSPVSVQPHLKLPAPPFCSVQAGPARRAEHLVSPLSSSPCLPLASLSFAVARPPGAGQRGQWTTWYGPWSRSMPRDTIWGTSKAVRSGFSSPKSTCR